MAEGSARSDEAAWLAVVADADLTGLEPLASRLLQSILAEVDARTGAVWIDEGEGFAHVAGDETAGALLDLTEAHAPAQAAASGRTTIHPAGAASELAVPLISEGAVFGVICVRFESPPEPALKARVEFIAGVAAGPLSRARLAKRLKLAFARLERAHADERRARREMEDFALWVTHDIREPLRSLRTLAEILRREFEPSPEAVSIVERIATLSDRVRARVLRLSTLSEASRAGSLETIEEVAPIVARAIDEARERHPDRHVPIEVDIATPRGLRASPDALRLAVTELVANAVEHADGERPVVSIRSESSTVGWSLAVTDNGPGIPGELVRPADAAMSRGLQGVDAQAAGLGLAIVRRVAERHEGALTITNARGRTTATLTIPVRGQATDRGAPRSLRAPHSDPIR
ncbi:MAG TPA: HAMP domain-containing sensor histidine kinase [Candidatus Thermoplasmatota archaeon]|nr:HAMP domain-containing sensor histidine kinase [Candidatus Thermoplasmatota archaeon]